MKSFLHQAAEYIYQKYPENISQICVVLPTRRASIYFKNALAQVATEGIWSPEVSLVMLRVRAAVLSIFWKANLLIGVTWI